MRSHTQTNENNNAVINDKLHSAVDTSSTCVKEKLDDKEDTRNSEHFNSTSTTSRQNNPYEEASFFSRVRTIALEFFPITSEKKSLTNIQMENTCFFSS
jgi:hypothetical protein